MAGSPPGSPQSSISLKKYNTFLELAKVQTLLTFAQEYIGDPRWTPINLLMAIVLLVCVIVEEFFQNKQNL